MSIDHDLRPGLAAELPECALDARLVDRLDEVAPASLTGEDLAAYVRARWQLQSRATAQLLEALHHLGRAEAARTERRSGLDEFSGDEVSGLLGWSRTMSARKLDLADDLLVRLPEVGDALHEGRIDEPKARTFCEWTSDLSDDHAHAACRLVLPEAPELPVGALRERLEQVVLALDPDWAERRRKRAESRARVLLSPNPSGTANLSFCDAPTPDGIASQARIDALAAAVRHLGVLTPIGALRLQVGMRLLDGSTAGMTDRDIALLLAAEYHAEPSPTEDRPAEPSDDEGGDDKDGPDDDPGHDPDDGPGDSPDDGPLDPDGDAGPAADDAPADSSRRPTPGQGRLELPGLPDDPEPPGPAMPPAALDRTPGCLRQGSVEVRLRLTTALGLDELPGSVTGYGAVLPHDARALLWGHRHGEWRVVLTDPDGRLDQVLLARRRPARHPGPRGRHRTRGHGSRRTAAIVELQVPTTVLAGLRPDDHGVWAPLLTELQQRLAERGRHDHDRPGRPPDADAGLDEWARRRPGVEVDRWTRTRDRHCVAPACRRSAHRADLDHTRDHAVGGPTATWNLGAWCQHHHRAKHHGGWRVRQPAPGRFVIRTRAGVTHTTAPRRVLEPLPTPCPTAQPRPLPDDGWDDHPEPPDPDWLTKVAPKAATTLQRAPRARTSRTDLPDEPPF
ncbi:HNH endonuclease signature motif containing protein [Actinomycetospora lemnae]|uniref:DUF222 domain-containing protein n=1 Tax=Actinomycetospora lemnae TaxID=3019891 RepID=A0ABT5SVB6_9PSEU|nr:HNH endonuclease signature motif containing protein [Actinomycetospora sp. DW7H6]MDD7966808.1 DUF222 domain-containing protein [Actinomycetospora sp. DW7H6]